MNTDHIDPRKTRLIAASDAMSEVLDDGEWHGKEDLVDVALAATSEEPLQRKTILDLLSHASRDGQLERWPTNAKRAKYGARKFRLAKTD